MAPLMHVWFERHWLCLLAGTGGVFSMFMARLFFVKHIHSNHMYIMGSGAIAELQTWFCRHVVDK